MVHDELIREIQRLYPLLYFACHRSHARADGLGESDLRLLHHIDGRARTFASELARHLGLSRSRMSEALGRLEDGGLIERAPDAAGRKRISLTDAGAKALTASDGLDPEAVGAVLGRLDEGQRQLVVDALRLLADAIRRHES